MTYKVLIGATGSVASLKIPDIVHHILILNKTNSDVKFEVKLIVTKHAEHFFDILDLPKSIEVHEDEHEWSTWKQRGDPVLHIELGKWADLLLIAPLDANTLAKMAQGICDNLLTCTTRAWDMKKPLIFCPAMNTRMWEHPITKQQIGTLKSWGHVEIPPISKKLMCGDIGVGAMAHVDDIVKHVINVSGWKD